VLARNEGVAYGMADVRTVVAPHPLAGIREDERKRMAAIFVLGIEQMFLMKG